MHRLTIHRTYDAAAVTLDFTLPDTADADGAIEEALRFKSMLVYDVDNPVYAVVVKDADGSVHAVSVATGDIDYLTLEPIV